MFARFAFCCSTLLCIVALGTSAISPPRAYGVGLTITKLASTGDWNVAGSWDIAVPGVGDAIILPVGSGNVIVTAAETFGGAGTVADSIWEDFEIRFDNSDPTLTHGASAFTFRLQPDSGDVLRLRHNPTNANGGTFVNNGAMTFRPEDDLSLGQFRLNDEVNFTNNGTFTYTLDGLASGDNHFRIEDNNSTVTLTGASSMVVSMGTGNSALFGFDQTDTGNSLVATPGGGKVFNVTSGNFLFGTPTRGTFTVDGTDFTDLGGGAPLHTVLDAAAGNNPYDTLFGGAAGDIPAGSNVGISGAYDTIDLISAPGPKVNDRDNPYLGRIGIGDPASQDNGNILPRGSGSTLTITSQTDADWYGGGFDTFGGTIDNNGTLTARTGAVFSLSSALDGPNNPNLIISESSGTGVFNNNVGATIRIEEGRLEFRDSNNTFHNFGTFELAGNNAHLWTGDDSSGSFILEAGGTFTAAPGGGNLALLTADDDRKPFNNDTGGAGISVSDGTFHFAPGLYQTGGVTETTLNNALLTSALSVAGGAAIEVGGGAWTTIDIDPGALGFTVTGHIRSDLLPTLDGGTLTIGDKLAYEWSRGQLDLDGGTITNNTTITKTTRELDIAGNTGGANTRLFINNGTILNQSGGDIDLETADTEFRNFGTLRLGDGTGGGDEDFDFRADNQLLHNRLGGVITSQTQTESQTNRINRGGNGSTTGILFRNEGTLEVTRGTLHVVSTNASFEIDSQSATSTELVEGTWRVISMGTDLSRMDLDAIPGVSGPDEDAYNGSIVSIATDASLVLSADEAIGTDAGAQFPQLGAIGTIDGSMHIHDAVVFDLAAATSVSGTLGGDGTYNSTTITFTGSSLDPSALDGTGGTLDINANLILDNETILDFYLDTPGEGGPNDLVNVDGNLTLDGVLTVEGPKAPGTYRLFNYSGTFADNGLLFGPGVFGFLDLTTPGQVNLNLSATPIPEPSTALLLGLGMFGLLRRVRRRRNVG